MSPRDPRAPLREADAAFQSTPLPPQALARLRRRVLDGASPSRMRWVVAGAAVALLVAVVAYAFFTRRPDVEDVQLASTESYRTDDVDVVATSPSFLHRDHERLAVRSGEVVISVTKRKPGQAPVRIEVSHGVIEVLGTRFTIQQRAEGGRVTLHEGSIRFISAAVTRELAPGESLDWPEAVAELPPPPVEGIPTTVPAPESPAPAPTPKRPRPRATRTEPAVIRETDAAWLLEEVDLLRSRGEYAEAVRLLDKGLVGIVSAATRERFSFELGSILTYQQGEVGRACRQWASHQAAFPSGRYAREVQSAMEKAKCGSH